MKSISFLSDVSFSLMKQFERLTGVALSTSKLLSVSLFHEMTPGQRLYLSLKTFSSLVKRQSISYVVIGSSLKSSKLQTSFLSMETAIFNFGYLSMNFFDGSVTQYQFSTPLQILKNASIFIYSHLNSKNEVQTLLTSSPYLFVEF